MTLPRESDFATDGDPRDPHDRDRSGYSLANNRELVFGCLEAAGAGSVVEIGSEYGAFTRELLAWAGDRARVIAVDPRPMPELYELDREQSATGADRGAERRCDSRPAGARRLRRRR